MKEFLSKLPDADKILSLSADRLDSFLLVSMYERVSNPDPIANKYFYRAELENLFPVSVIFSVEKRAKLNSILAESFQRLIAQNFVMPASGQSEGVMTLTEKGKSTAPIVNLDSKTPLANIAGKTKPEVQAQEFVDQSMDFVRHAIDIYRQMVKGSHGVSLLNRWPLLSGFSFKYTEYQNTGIFLIFDTPHSPGINFSTLPPVLPEVLDNLDWSDSTKESIRHKMGLAYHIKPRDAVMFRLPTDRMSEEIDCIMEKHESTMGLAPMKIFLSHKGADKPLVRNFKATLQLLGFDPWLDEDAMAAGTNLERGLLKGFQDSCGAVFFITPNYVDEGYLAKEVDYAVQEKMKKNERFSIITLVLTDNTGKKGTAPELLHTYVWKEPKTDLEAIREIIRALPIEVGPIQWRTV